MSGQKAEDGSEDDSSSAPASAIDNTTSRPVSNEARERIGLWFEQHGAAIRRFAIKFCVDKRWRLTDGDADDVVQRIFEKCLHDPDRSIRAPLPYLCSMATRLIYDDMRRKARVDKLIAETEEPPNDVAADIGALIDGQFVAEALATLESQDQLILRYWSSGDIAAIQALCGVDRNGANYRVRVALEELKARIEQLRRGRAER